MDFPKDYLMKHDRNIHQHNKKMTSIFDSFLMKFYTFHSYIGRTFQICLVIQFDFLFLCTEYTNNITQLLLLKTFAFQSKTFWLTSRKYLIF